MNFITKPLYEHAKLFMLLSFALAIILTGIFLRLNYNKVEEDETRGVEYDSMTNATGTEPRKTRRKEYLYRLLTNTTRSLIQMEIKARRLEENMRRIKEKTADLLWKNKDKALWHILFKNISRHISIRHEFHQHSSLKRIMHDSHGHVHNRRRKVFLSSKGGPGYASPMEAFKNGPREELLYVVCVQPDQTKQDYLATVDVDPKSPTYAQIIYRTYTGSSGDELHHSGWNVCSSCYSNEELKRNLLILPALQSCKVFAVDVGTDPRKPELHKVIDGSEMRSVNCSFPHTAHCLASGEIMISTMGDKDENGKGDFVLIDAKTLKVTGTWTKGEKLAKFGYDFWYQPYHDVMIASEWGTPKYFKTGFHPEDIPNKDRYGTTLNVYKWSSRELQQVIDLGQEGCAPLEIRFLHDPKAAQGFVGCAVEANVYRFYKTDNSWEVHKVIDVPAKKVVKDGEESELNGLISDILISLDDKYMYFSCWLHGDVRQYDISDPANPKLTGQVFLGGQIACYNLGVIEDKELKEPPKPMVVKGKRLQGGPQMLQLSLDGKRLYVSSSLYSPWDKQFYPNMTKEGGWIVKLDVDTTRGGMKLDPEFLVDFGTEPDGPVLPHEMRYPGGDCTSDIWLAED